jgi:hypothetical protein
MVVSFWRGWDIIDIWMLHDALRSIGMDWLLSLEAMTVR